MFCPLSLFLLPPPPPRTLKKRWMAWESARNDGPYTLGLSKLILKGETFYYRGGGQRLETENQQSTYTFQLTSCCGPRGSPARLSSAVLTFQTFSLHATLLSAPSLSAWFLFRSAVCRLRTVPPESLAPFHGHGYKIGQNLAGGGRGGKREVAFISE